MGHTTRMGEAPVRTALVTGGSKGIGLATVAALLKTGYRVATCARSQEELEIAKATLGSEDVVVLPADLSLVEDCARVVEATFEAFGHLDAVVNNAGIYVHGLVEEVSPDSWDQTFAVNVRAPYLVARNALRYLRSSDAGTVVNIASTNGMMSEAGYGAYNASKAALLSMTETMAVEWATDGIRVNAVAPGWIHTPLSEEVLATLTPEQIAAVFPMGRIGSAEDVANVVAYLCSPDSCAYLTGATIRVDGGMLSKHPAV
jgi:NAD(P)-dependent dehydrogenase (short-subunit alcohol dehydrogenase family)